MSDAGLVDLAERFVRLSSELDATRDAMRRLLLNGAAEPGPFSLPVRRELAGKGTAEAEARIIELLREQPNLGTSAIAKAMSANIATTQDRLKRLRSRGEIEGGQGGGWRTPPPPA
jgi:hypothetical protein